MIQELEEQGLKGYGTKLQGVPRRSGISAKDNIKTTL